jgi:ferrous iron transport protein A
METKNLTSISLAELHFGEQALLMNCDTIKTVSSRLVSLGFTPGVRIEMRQNNGRGPLVVNVRGTRVALGRQEANQIFVKRDRK